MRTGRNGREGGGMKAQMFDGLFTGVICLFVVTIVSAPLALWKLVDIALWALRHVDVVIQ